MSFWQRLSGRPEKISRLYIPRLNDGLPDVRKMAQLYWLMERNAKGNLTIPVDFTDCDFLRPPAVAMLGGIIGMAEARGAKVPLLRPTLKPQVHEALRNNGFLAAHGIDAQPYANNAVAYRHDAAVDARAYAAFLRDEWITPNWINVGREVRQEIVQSVVEIYNNAFEHGKSRIGVFTVGQRFPTLDEVSLAVVDFGATIPGTVHGVRGNERLPDQEAIAWALKSGNTSRPNISRGLGFDVLVDLVSGPGSHMEIYSRRGMVKVKDGRIDRLPLDFEFPGTMLLIDVNAATIRHKLLTAPKPQVNF
jgi:hypothetical protein